MSQQPAFYGRTGSPIGDFLTLLHIPYTAWHLSYVVIGATLATELDLRILTGTVLAFTFGLGISAHAFDELHDRPLGTAMSRKWLMILGVAGLGAASTIAILAAVEISPIALIWGGIAVGLVLAYSLELIPWVHTTTGFALAWGSFPVLVGYWAQTETLSIGAIAVAGSAALFSAAQRSLSTPARHIRRRAHDASAMVGDVGWDRDRLLGTWEKPLRLIAAAHVVFALGLLSSHLID